MYQQMIEFLRAESKNVTEAIIALERLHKLQTKQEVTMQKMLPAAPKPKRIAAPKTNG